MLRLLLGKIFTQVLSKTRHTPCCVEFYRRNDNVSALTVPNVKQYSVLFFLECCCTYIEKGDTKDGKYYYWIETREFLQWILRCYGHVGSISPLDRYGQRTSGPAAYSTGTVPSPNLAHRMDDHDN